MAVNSRRSIARKITIHRKSCNSISTRLKDISMIICNNWMMRTRKQKSILMILPSRRRFPGSRAERVCQDGKPWVLSEARIAET
jgi:hypothetical protein